MYSFPKPTRYTRRRLRFALPAIILLATACASTPPVPSASLQAAQQAIANAERVEAGAHAAAELAEARTKMSAAQQAVTEKEMLAAGQRADEARASAELAAARTSVAKANAVNRDMKNSTSTLIDEMQRKTGDGK